MTRLAGILQQAFVFCVLRFELPTSYLVFDIP